MTAFALKYDRLLLYFNSHAHVERDPDDKYDACVTEDFNSHAHVERDSGDILSFSALKISTHTLTWSVTKGVKEKMGSKIISTHTLTWSVTSILKSCNVAIRNFNSHAHVERDGVFEIFVKFFTNFNSHAHVERDMGRFRLYIE